MNSQACQRLEGGIDGILGKPRRGGGTVAPPGLGRRVGLSPRGSHPWLLTAAPSGANTNCQTEPCALLAIHAYRNHANSFSTTLPCTSVSRKSRPWKRNVNSRVVEAEQLQQRRVQIVNVDAVFDRVEAEFVRLAQRQARLDAAAGHPVGEGVGMVVAAVVAAAFHHRRSAELAAP